MTHDTSCNHVTCIETVRSAVGTRVTMGTARLFLAVRNCWMSDSYCKSREGGGCPKKTQVIVSLSLLLTVSLFSVDHGTTAGI
jgi:hypothetical protein